MKQLVSLALCHVFASGSPTILSFAFLNDISTFNLHLGQNNGNFSSVVSGLIFILVLFWHRGHSNHSLSKGSPP